MNMKKHRQIAPWFKELLNLLAVGNTTYCLFSFIESLWGPEALRCYNLMALQVAFSRFSWAENYSENDGAHPMRPRLLRRVTRGEGESR